MIKVNGKIVDVELFPNAELKVDTDWDLSTEEVLVEFKYFSSSDLIALALVLGHIHQETSKKVKLYVYYMPYSRMDRNQNGNCYSLLHIIDLLTHILYCNDEVFIVEPHSEKTKLLFNYLDPRIAVKVVPLSLTLAKKVMKIYPVDVICYPDKGARERFGDIGSNIPVIYCEKKRDFDTGNIIGLELISSVDLVGKKVMIIDDLCSKGGTFYHTANKLKEAGAAEIYLTVTHMESNVKYGKILIDDQGHNADSPISHIFCTNSMLDERDLVISGRNITVYDLPSLIFSKKLKEVICE